MKESKKVALVTGGARRLGRDICIALAEAGFEIVLNYNESRKSILEETISAITSAGTGVTAVKCDITDIAEVRKMFHAVYLRYKRLDVLVNNAAIFRHTDFSETSEKTFYKFIDTNLKSVFFCSQEASKIMTKSGEDICRIINIASLGAIENWTGYIPYSVSKAGVIKLTEQLAKKLAPGIIVNAVSPGTVLIDKDENENVNPEEVNKYPMKRFARSSDITGLIVYLATLNTYITGHNFIVDGGKSL